MKPSIRLLRTVLSCAALVLPLLSSPAATTINPADKFAWGANIGWIDWRANTNDGAVVGAFVCSGSIWSANAGWIELGDGSPTGGIRYQNNAPTDFGVNHDGAGNLNGYAWGANIGWLTFTNRTTAGTSYDGPKVDLLTGRLSGFVWSENVGWISLSNQFAHVRTDSMDCGPDSDGDGLPDQWELQFTANLATLNGMGDADLDGLTNLEEFEADTNPLVPGSRLRISNTSKSTPTAPTTITWASSPTRLYRVRAAGDISTPLPWPELAPGLLAPAPGSTTTVNVPAGPEPFRFFVIEAVKPLSP